jgi:plasmid stabilization system protein ParE
MTIIWTIRALNSYFNVADYLKEQWSLSVATNFTDKVEKVFSRIKDSPSMFEESEKYKHVRRGFITEHISLYYRIRPRKKEVELLIFWDNRKDDKKCPY